MIYDDERAAELKAEREYPKYVKDPPGWMRRNARATWIFFILFYVPLLVIAILVFLPSAAEINAYLATPRSLTWFPLSAGVGSICILGLKMKCRIAFGATELGFAVASAFAGVSNIASPQSDAWLIAIGVIYLYVKGFDDIIIGITDLKRK